MSAPTPGLTCSISPPLRSATLWLNNNKDDIGAAIATAAAAAERYRVVMQIKRQQIHNTTKYIWGGLRPVRVRKRNKYFQYLPVARSLHNPNGA